MVLNTKDYADFKSAVASMGDVDGIFYNSNVTVGGNVLFVALAYSSQPECAANLAIDMGASPPSLATFAADFPNAVQVNQYVKASDHSEYSL